MIAKYRGETFWLYPTVLNSGSPQSMRVWAELTSDGYQLSQQALGDLATGESREFTLEMRIPAEAPAGLYDVRILVFEASSQVEEVIYEEADVLEVIAFEKSITAVRYS